MVQSQVPDLGDCEQWGLGGAGKEPGVGVVWRDETDLWFTAGDL